MQSLTTSETLLGTVELVRLADGSHVARGNYNGKHFVVQVDESQVMMLGTLLEMLNNES